MRYSPRLIQSLFRQAFQKDPLMVRAPGRINLIGEHTDYNDGFVMPAAVDREIWFALAPSDEPRTVLYAHQYGEALEVDLDSPLPVRSPQWANYLLGVIKQFQDTGHVVRPFRCLFAGDVPQGAGMSSSAALSCGFATALNEHHGWKVAKPELILIAQWAEHHYAGVRCGIMDQFASMMGRRGHALLLDCRSMEHTYLPLDLERYAVVLCDTQVKHALADSAYNTRRAECETGVTMIQRHHPEVRNLRDVTTEMLDRMRDHLPRNVYSRCAYVVREIARVQEGARDLSRGDLPAFGQKMFATHRGLSVQYEVSCEELDFLVDEAKGHEGVLGARMMGGGFGGCTINLVEADAADAFMAVMRTSYGAQYDTDLPCHRVNLVEGAGPLARENSGLPSD